MANYDVIPKKDSEFDSFQDNLVAKCTANAVAWNISAPALAELATPQTNWEAAWAIAKIKVNRTPAQVATKKLARKVYVEYLRDFIQAQLYRNASVNNDNIVECGLKPRDTTRTPVPVPASLPVINISYGPGDVMVVRFFRLDDETGAIRRGKPFGVVRIEFAYNYINQPADVDACAEWGTATRSPFRVMLPPSLRGQKVWYYARWVNTREEYGPWTELDFAVL